MPTLAGTDTIAGSRGWVPRRSAGVRSNSKALSYYCLAQAAAPPPTNRARMISGPLSLDAVQLDPPPRGYCMHTISGMKYDRSLKFSRGGVGHGLDARGDWGLSVAGGRGCALKKTADILFARMVAQQSVCLRRLGGGRAGEVRFGRFMANRRVSVAELVHGACADVDD